MMKKVLLSMKWSVPLFGPFYSLVSAAAPDYKKHLNSYSKKLHNFRTQLLKTDKASPFTYYPSDEYYTRGAKTYFKTYGKP